MSVRNAGQKAFRWYRHDRDREEDYLGCSCCFPTDISTAGDSWLVPLRGLPRLLTPRGLMPQHRDDLGRSGLSDETIEASHCHSLTNMGIIRRSLNWRPSRQHDTEAIDLGPCLVFPYLTLYGRFDGFARLKPDRPRVEVNGSIVKYEQPKRRALRPYFAWPVLEAIRDPLAPIGFTEGEKKALKASQEGFPCIGLAGAWGWQQRRERDQAGGPIGERQLLDDLQRISWANRPAWIAFDADPLRNPDVNHAAAELARILSELGADV